MHLVDNVMCSEKYQGNTCYKFLNYVPSLAQTYHHVYHLHFRLRIDYLCIHLCASPTITPTYSNVLNCKESYMTPCDVVTQSIGAN